MNDEIKEIIDDLRTYKDRYEYSLFNNLSFSDRDYKAKILLDYITNLQQENERLKEELQQEKKDFKETNDYCFELKGYKSRIDKAIEHIEKHQFIFQSQYGDESNFDNHLLDILKGDSNE